MNYPDDEFDPVIRRRRALKAKARKRFLVAVFVCSIVATSVVAILLLRAIPAGRTGLSLIGGPSQSSEGNKWTLKELHDHLKERGAKCTMHNAGSGVEVLFVFARNAEEAENAVQVYKLNYLENPIVVCYKHDDAERARDFAGADPKRSFAWGRFIFRSREDYTKHLDEIHRILYGKPFPK